MSFALRVAALIAFAAHSPLASGQPAARSPFVSPKAPAGPYFLFSDTASDGRYVSGEVVIVPNGSGYQVLGYRSQNGPRARATSDTLAVWIDSPLSVTSKGEVVSAMIDNLAGGFLDDGLLILFPIDSTPERGWSRLVLTRSDESVESLADANGVYELFGLSGQYEWEGTLAVVRSPYYRIEGGVAQYQAQVRLDIAYAGGGRYTGSGIAHMTRNGRMHLQTSMADGNALVVDGEVAAGQAAVLIKAWLTSDHYRPITARGAKGPR